MGRGSRVLGGPTLSRKPGMTVTESWCQDLSPCFLTSCKINRPVRLVRIKWIFHRDRVGSWRSASNRPTFLGYKSWITLARDNEPVSQICDKPFRFLEAESLRDLLCNLSPESFFLRKLMFDFELIGQKKVTERKNHDSKIIKIYK